MTYKIGTSHMCRKCGGAVIAEEADDEVKRLRALLEEAAHVIIAHQCKDISEEWCAKWGARYEAMDK